MAEFEKLQFIDTIPSRIPFESPIPEISKKYINALPHVRYTAVGLNFIGHYRCKDKEFALVFLPKKFLKDGTWNTYGDNIPYVGLKFIYTLKNVTCTINLDTVKVIHSNQQPQPIIVITANYHFDSTDKDKTISYIDDWKSRYNHLAKIILDTFPEGE